MHALRPLQGAPEAHRACARKARQGSELGGAVSAPKERVCVAGAIAPVGPRPQLLGCMPLHVVPHLLAHKGDGGGGAPQQARRLLHHACHVRRGLEEHALGRRRSILWRLALLVQDGALKHVHGAVYSRHGRAAQTSVLGHLASAPCNSGQSHAHELDEGATISSPLRCRRAWRVPGSRCVDDLHQEND